MRQPVSRLLAVCLLVAGCAGDGVIENAGGDFPEAQEELFWGPKPIRVLTRNLYVGTDIGLIFTASDPSEVPVLAAQAYAGVLASDPHGRIERMADEIWLTRPHLVGLQEVSLIRTQSPGDAAFGGTAPAEDVAFDYLEMLLDALAARGLDYRVAASVTNLDAEVPMLTPTFGLDDVRLTDRDVILARGDVVTANAVDANFATRFTQLGIEVIRGWTAVDATVGEREVRFVNTHLEAFVPLVRQAQAHELILALGAEPRPIIAVGDFNSSAAGGAAYGMLQAAGYVDAWNIRHAFPGSGFTCCQDADLRNPTSLLDDRIDLVFVRNMAPRLVLAFTVGDRTWQKTASGLWPSDHAGVVTALH